MGYFYIFNEKTGYFCKGINPSFWVEVRRFQCEIITIVVVVVVVKCDVWERWTDSCESLLNWKPIVLKSSIGVHVFSFGAHQIHRQITGYQLRVMYVICNPFTTQHVEINLSFFTLPLALISFSSSFWLKSFWFVAVFHLFSSAQSLARFHSLFCSWILFLSCCWGYWFAIGYANLSWTESFASCNRLTLVLVFCLIVLPGIQHWCVIWFEEICREKIVLTIPPALGFDTAGDRMRFLHLHFPFVVFRLTSLAFFFQIFFLLP